jgi:predicted unusual protein kinase regulating ubiquinone biosynthesis (AarF/ABC1/UbiB family)
MARSAKLAALPLAFAGRALGGWGRRLGSDAEAVSAATMQRNAEQLFAVLGQLKGGAMKVGQALSVYESMIPAEIAEPYCQALTRLQSSGPAMPTADVRRVLDEQLGRQWRRRFRDFDDVPAAAASVGQVHRAVLADGREVAVKVQYPGADLALSADLRTLQRFSKLFTLIVPALDARAVMRELRERVLEELDYRAEADRQRAFAAAFACDEALVVPAVVASAPKVLVRIGWTASRWARSPAALPSTPPTRPAATGTRTPSSTRYSPPFRKRVKTCPESARCRADVDPHRLVWFPWRYPLPA